jgi:hypothetical protein
VPDTFLAFSGRRRDLQRARGDAAGAAHAVRHAAVEHQRVALLERVDLAVEVDLEAATGHVEQHVARCDLVPLGPAAAAAGPLVDGERLTREGAHAARCGGVVVALVLAGVAPHQLWIAAAGRGAPEQADRDLQGAGYTLGRAGARAGEPALELAQEGMRQPGLPAELLQRPTALLPERADAGSERSSDLVRRIKHAFPE